MNKETSRGASARGRPWGHKGAADHNFPLPPAGSNWGEGDHNHHLPWPAYSFQTANPWLAAAMAEEHRSLPPLGLGRGRDGGTAEGPKVARATGGEQGVRSSVPQGAEAASHRLQEPAGLERDG